MQNTWNKIHICKGSNSCGNFWPVCNGFQVKALSKWSKLQILHQSKLATHVIQENAFFGVLMHTTTWKRVEEYLNR